jgi:hypothetical protein
MTTKTTPKTSIELPVVSCNIHGLQGSTDGSCPKCNAPSEFDRLKAQKDALVEKQRQAEMKKAYTTVAEAHGWDKMPLSDLKLLTNALFNYFVMRLP